MKLLGQAKEMRHFRILPAEKVNQSGSMKPHTFKEFYPQTDLILKCDSVKPISIVNNPEIVLPKP